MKLLILLVNSLLILNIIPFNLYSQNQLKGGILINEILFNPKPNGVDFIEIYNNTNDAIDLSNLYITNLHQITSSSKLQVISLTKQLLLPSQYLVLTKDAKIIASHYPSGKSSRYLQLPTLPALPNEQGTLLLVYRSPSKEWIVIDSLIYSSRMHNKFLKDVKGISLERQAMNRATTDPENFRSAAKHSEGATPGYRNSNYSEQMTYLNLNSKIVSPNSNPPNDILEINYNFPYTGLMANAIIVDSKGKTVKTLVKNSSIAAQGVWKWDILNESHGHVPMGIYTIFLELYNKNGIWIKKRKSFVVVH